MRIKKTSKIGIEEYAQMLPQYYGKTIPLTLKKYLDKVKYKSLIDCGCGDGALLFVLKQQNYFKGKTIYGTDLSKKRISLVKEIDPKIIAFVDDAEILKHVGSKSIDFFMTTHVIEHVDDKKMLRTIGRVVRKKGTIYIATVFKKPWGWYYYRKDGKWVMDVTHLREYMHDEELLGLVDRKKFKILEVKKTQLFFPVVDFVVRRLFVHNIIKDRELFVRSAMFNRLRSVKLPVPGYYNWEIVLRKEN